MKLEEQILTKNDCWKSGRTIKPKGVMVHSLGVAQPDVNVFLRMWNSPSVESCVHALVARDRVVQTLPWNWRGWHCYKGPNGSGNNTHISFELCEPKGHTYQGGTMIGYDAEKNAAYFSDVYRNAVELTAYLCKQYDLDPSKDGVVICHSEGYQRGIASNHADVMHWFPKHGKSMETFRADVARELKGEPEMTQDDFNAMFSVAMGTYITNMTALPTSTWAQEAWDKATKSGVLDGKRPACDVTREQLATVLDRLKLLN